MLSSPKLETILTKKWLRLLPCSFLYLFKEVLKSCTNPDLSYSQWPPGFANLRHVPIGVESGWNDTLVGITNAEYMEEDCDVGISSFRLMDGIFELPGINSFYLYYSSISATWSDYRHHPFRV